MRRQAARRHRASGSAESPTAAVRIHACTMPAAHQGVLYGIAEYSTVKDQGVSAQEGRRPMTSCQDQARRQPHDVARGSERPADSDTRDTRVRLPTTARPA